MQNTMTYQQVRAVPNNIKENYGQNEHQRHFGTQFMRWVKSGKSMAASPEASEVRPGKVGHLRSPAGLSVINRKPSVNPRAYALWPESACSRRRLNWTRWDNRVIVAKVTIGFDRHCKHVGHSPNTMTYLCGQSISLRPWTMVKSNGAIQWGLVWREAWYMVEILFILKRGYVSCATKMNEGGKKIKVWTSIIIVQELRDWTSSPGF